MKALKHFKTILTHKKYVFFFSRKLGIGWQGFWHDMSKFTPSEFFESVKYYTGTRSPIDACKEDKGYSWAWQNHKGRNPHHYEFWQDDFDKGTTHIDMPDKYVKEMICDYLAAGVTYNKGNFTFGDEYDWWCMKNSNSLAMHDSQKATLTEVFSRMNEIYRDIEISEMKSSDWDFFRTVVEQSLAHN